jgi:hypothetical protein
MGKLVFIFRVFFQEFKERIGIHGLIIQLECHCECMDGSREGET